MDDVKSFVSQKVERLDLFLAVEMGQTRSQISNLIKRGCVFVEDKIVSRPGVKLKVGQNIRVELPQVEKQEVEIG